MDTQEVKPVPGAAMDAGELAELVHTFNELTGKLESTHRSLRDEVERLKRELGQANAELERSRRLAALGEMAAGIAHEVRNPLGSIGLYARMLESDLTDKPGQMQTARKIVEAVRGLDAVVNDVLTFSREMKICPGMMTGGELMEGALLRVADLLSAANGPRLIRGPGLADERLLLEADRRLMTQALVNVIRNAVEATLEQSPTGGGVIALDVRTSAESAGGRRLGPMVVFVIRDTGPGVDAEVVERMFNPFFTTRVAGTGLGLPIVHRIVEAHGGRVVVRNNADAGEAPGASVELHVPARIRSGSVGRSSGAPARSTHVVMERAG
ncbi:MAG: hypothetical protein DYG94_08940 [Leptolyngbya sp. PLA3]|nr:MAG: hypothetical protein EDM82_02855 [Cyanobacteria bacterium CYA]MCE7968856.1 hypothetical protein [Leptolyngbya sp. PL-A3]